MYPSDDGYNEFRNFKNAEIVNEDTDDEYIVFYTHNKSKLTTLGASEKHLLGIKDEKQSKEEKLEKIIRFLSFLDNTKYSNLTKNAVKELGFDINNAKDIVEMTDYFYGVYMQNKASKEDSFSNDKLLTFYKNNEKEILSDILDDTEEFCESEEEIHENIFKIYKCENGNQTDKQIAFAKYAIYSVARHCCEYYEYDTVESLPDFDYCRSNAKKLLENQNDNNEIKRARKQR